MKRSAGKEGPTFSKLHRVRGKKVSLIAETVPPRSPPMRKNRGMEVPVIGIPLRRAIRAIRDAAWKQIRRGKGARSGGRESQRERGCELLSLFFISRPRPLLLTGSIPFYPSSAPFRTPPFATLSFFLSFLPVYATHDPPASIRFRFRPSSRSVFFTSVHRPLSTHFQACVQSLLFTGILLFSIELFNFSVFIFFF